jgi:hypothetical protein
MLPIFTSQLSSGIAAHIFDRSQNGNEIASVFKTIEKAKPYLHYESVL